MTSIDLNSDIGESFSGWTMGEDDAMLQVVSSANVACGFHAGDARVMRHTVRVAKENGVAIGAHVAYNDLAGFGRRNMDVASDDLVAELIYQIGALQAMAATVGAQVRYVKPHGALYNTIVHDERQAKDVVTAVREVDPSLVILGLPDSVILAQADKAGVPTAREAFADRAYNPDGTLVSRRLAGAVLHDPDEVAKRMIGLVQDGGLVAVDGSWIKLQADSICVHGDTPGSREMAEQTAARLRDAGLTLKPFAG